MTAPPFLPGRVVYDPHTGLYEDVSAARSSFYEEKYLALHPTMHREDAAHKFDGIDKVLHAIDCSTVRIVLDVGCGSCEVLRRLLDEIRRRAGCEPAGIGLDVSERILASGATDQRILRLRGDSTDLPFESASISLALCIDIIEHVTEPAVALREIARVCERAIFKVPLERSMYTTIRGGERRLARLRDKYGHVNQYDRAALLALLEEHFDIEVEEYMPIPRRGVAMEWLQRGLLWLSVPRLYAATIGGFAIVVGKSHKL